jgi:hypothetical protein
MICSLKEIVQEASKNCVGEKSVNVTAGEAVKALLAEGQEKPADNREASQGLGRIG